MADSEACQKLAEVRAELGSVLQAIVGAGRVPAAALEVLQAPAVGPIHPAAAEKACLKLQAARTAAAPSLATEVQPGGSEAEVDVLQEQRRRLLSERGQQMEAMAARRDASLPMKRFVEMFPVAPDEAERVLAVRDLRLMELALPIPGVEAVLRPLCVAGTLGKGLTALMVNLLNDTMQRTVAVHVHMAEGEWMGSDRVRGLPTASIVLVLHTS